MGCCLSTKQPNIQNIQKRRHRPNEGSTGGAASIDQANDHNEIVIEVRPGDLPLKDTPLKFLNVDDNSRISSSMQSYRNTSKRRYPQNDPSLSGAPVPTALQWQKDCISAVILGDLSKFKNLLSHQCNKVTNSVVQIRGHNIEVQDLSMIEDEAIETLMWNPLHFAVYYNHIHIVKHIIETLGVNIGLTAHKPNGESEKDPTNSIKFAEDKIILLLIAMNKRHIESLKYLLDELCQFWSRKNFQNLIEKLPQDIETKSCQIRDVVFGSKTAHSFFESMGFKKRNEWLVEYIRKISSDYEDSKILLMPFTKRPYAGLLLNYLLFEENCSEYDLLHISMQNMTTGDYQKIIYSMPGSWTDIPAEIQDELPSIEVKPDFSASKILPAAPSLRHNFSRMSAPIEPPIDAGSGSDIPPQSQNTFSQDEISEQNISTPRDFDIQLGKRKQGGLGAHFDLNRMMKLEEKFENEKAVSMLHIFIDKLIETQQLIGMERESGIRNKISIARAELVRCSASQNVGLSKFTELVHNLKMQFEIDAYEGLLTVYDRQDKSLVSLDKVPQSRISIGAVRPSDQTTTRSRKWHPLTYAIHNENIVLIKHLVEKVKCPLKKLLFVPEMSKQSPLCQMFPYRHELLFLFWDNKVITPQEDQLNNLLRMSKLKDSDLQTLIDCSTTKQLFYSMSYQYRYTFMETVIHLRQEMIREIEIVKKDHLNKQPFKADVGASCSAASIQSNDSDVFYEERKAQIINIFYGVFTRLTQPVYALHFYQTLCKEMAKHGFVDQKLVKILDEAYNNISAMDIEMFLFYESESALQLVKEHVESRSPSNNLVDKSLRKLALKVSKNTHYKFYAQQPGTDVQPHNLK